MPTIKITKKADKAMKHIGNDAKLVAAKIEALAENMGDIKKLSKPYDDEYRLRAGNWRVIFTREGDSIIIQDIVRRNESTYD